MLASPSSVVPCLSQLIVHCVCKSSITDRIRELYYDTYDIPFSCAPGCRRDGDAETGAPGAGGTNE